MAGRQFDWTDGDGRARNDLVWDVGFVSVDLVNRQVRTIYFGWKNQASLDAGERPVPGAVSELVAGGEDFDAAATDKVLSAMTAAGWEVADARGSIFPDPAPAAAPKAPAAGGRSKAAGAGRVDKTQRATPIEEVEGTRAARPRRGR